jgi:hypothetical protein
VDAARIFSAKWGISRDQPIAVAIQELAAEPFDPARDRFPLNRDDDHDGAHDDEPPLIAAA